MEYFWQFFAVGAFSLVVGIQIGRSAAISQLLLQQQQQGAQPQIPPQLMQQLFNRPQANNLPNGPTP